MGAPAATLLATSCLAVVSALLVLFPGSVAFLVPGADGGAGDWAGGTPWRVRSEAAAFGAAHLLGLGFVIAGFVAGWMRLAARRAALVASLLRWRLACLGATLVAALALGAWLLPRDLTNFSQRQTAVPPGVALGLGVFVIAAAVPAALAAGWMLRSRWGRSAAAVALLVVAIGNQTQLPNDYFVIHLFIALTALALTSSAWTGARLGVGARLLRPQTGAIGFAAAAVGVLLVPSAPAATALASATGAVASPWIAEVRNWFAGDKGASAEGVDRGPWFERRTDAPPVPPTGPQLVANPVVILITVDALRADVIASGKHDAELPTFAQLRQRGVWFSNARSTASLTKMSIAGLMLGTHFIQQHWMAAGRFFTPSFDPTERFPARLQRAGVRTMNFRSVEWLKNGNVLGGFDEEELGSEKGKRYASSRAVFKKLLPRIATIGPEPTFIYSHLADPHAPYDLGRSDGTEFERYVAEVALVDRHLGKLLTALEKAKLLERTILIVSADHGEAFGEHKSRTHGTTVYDEVLRIPLLFLAPGVTPRRVDDLVSLLDLGPTVLDLFGQETPGYCMGQSLVPYLRGENPKLERPIFAETRRVQAWITPDHKKLIYDTRTGRLEFYHLDTDPLELENVASDPAAQAVFADLQAFVAAHQLALPGYEPPYFR